MSFRYPVPAFAQYVDGRTYGINAQEQALPRINLLVRVIVDFRDIEHLPRHLHELEVRSSPLLETEVAYRVLADQILQCLLQ